MGNLTPEEKKEIIDTLEARKVMHACPRCNNKQRSLVDGYLNEPIQKEIGNINIGGPSVPSVLIVCTNCGFMSQHALGTLNLLPKEKDGKDEK